MKKILALAVCLALTPFATSQQLEVNSPGGSLTRAGTNPTVGVPFNVTVGNNIDVRVGGGGNLPFILLYSDQLLANPSTDFGGIFGGQYLDLDQNGIVILADGIGGIGALPTIFAMTNGVGVSNFSFPTNAAFAGGKANFQGIMFDGTLPFNLNFTAACAFNVVTAVSFNGDDLHMVYSLPLAPFNICGITATQITASTNGWMTFNAETLNDLSETSGEFITANPGSTTIFSGVPMASVMWEDLNMIAASGGLVTIDQVNPSTITVTWANGSYFSAPTGVWGTNVLTITDVGSGVAQLTFDYTGFNHATPPSEGLVGFSSGVNGATTTAADISTAGTINPFASGPGANNYFQSFDGVHAPAVGPVASPFDLGGQLMTVLVASDCSIIVF